MSMCAFNPTGGLYGLDKKGFSPRLCPGRLPGEQADCHIHFEDNWARSKFYAGAGGGAQRPVSCCLSPVKTIAWQDRLGTNLKKNSNKRTVFRETGAGGAVFWGVNVTNNTVLPQDAALPKAAQAVVAAAGPRY